MCYWTSSNVIIRFRTTTLFQKHFSTDLHQRSDNKKLPTECQPLLVPTDKKVLGFKLRVTQFRFSEPRYEKWNGGLSYSRVALGQSMSFCVKNILMANKQTVNAYQGVRGPNIYFHTSIQCGDIGPYHSAIGVTRVTDYVAWPLEPVNTNLWDV